MNIIEAVKLGKPFRRKGMKAWYRKQDLDSGIYFYSKDFLEEDWEVYEEKLELSWEQIKKAINDSHIENGANGQKFMSGIKEKLGFSNE